MRTSSQAQLWDIERLKQAEAEEVRRLVDGDVLLNDFFEALEGVASLNA